MKKTECVWPFRVVFPLDGLMGCWTGGCLPSQYFIYFVVNWIIAFVYRVYKFDLLTPFHFPPCVYVANFSLPSLDLGWFEEIKYTDVEGDAAAKAVQEYNTKGRKALPPPAKKRPNYDYRSDNRRRGECFLCVHFVEAGCHISRIEICAIMI